VNVTKPDLRPSDLAPGLVVGPAVEIAPDAVLGIRVVMHAGTVVGPRCRIADGAVLGKSPRLAPWSRSEWAAPAPLRLETGVVVGTGAVLYAGARLEAQAVVGDGAGVGGRARIGPVTALGAGVAVGGGAALGSRVRVEPGAWLTAGTIVEDEVRVGPWVRTLNDNTMARLDAATPLTPPVLRRGCRVGARAMLTPGVEIGPGAEVEAGSVVTRDVPGGARVAGVPARPRP
jgi:UDP-2-acetamido-3-amino-2,3-dideoxy-glucuronate N-acetyltransferase